MLSIVKRLKSFFFHRKTEWFTTTEAAKDVFKKAAFDFIVKPFWLECPRLIITKATEKLGEQNQSA